VQQKWVLWALTGLVLAAACARGQGLGLRSLSLDEAIAWRLSQYSWEELLARAATDVHPPLYFLLLKLWTLLGGDSVESMRLLSGLCGTGVVGVVYLLARDAFRIATGSACGATGVRAEICGLLAAALLAASVYHIEYSRQVRMYAPGGLLAAVAGLCLLRVLNSREHMGWYWAGFVTSAAALAYMHNFGLVSVVGLAAFGVALGVRRRQGIPWLWFSRGVWMWSGFALVAAAYAPWLPMLRQHAARVVADYWTGELEWVHITGAIEQMLSGLVEPMAPVAGPTAAALLGGMLCAAAWRAGRVGTGLALLCVAPVIAGVCFAWVSGRNVLIGRCFNFVFPYVVVCTSLVVSLIPGPRIRGTAAVLLAGNYVWQTALWWHRMQSNETPGLQAAARVVLRHALPTDTLAAVEPGDYLALAYYTRNWAGRLYLVDATPTGTPHVDGLFAVPGQDQISIGALWGADLSRLWLVHNKYAAPPYRSRPPDVQLSRSWQFAEAAPYRGDVYLYLLERQRPAALTAAQPAPGTTHRDPMRFN
jgi:hypothetical protein